MRALYSTDQIRKRLQNDAPSYAVRENELLRLEEVSKNLIQDQEKHRRSLEDAFARRNDQLEQNYKKKNDDLVAQEENLKKRRQELDDRESRHVRRDHQKKMNEVFASRAREFKLSDGTRNLRNPIRTFTIVLLCFFGFGLVLSLLSSFKILGVEQNNADLITTRISLG